MMMAVLMPITSPREETSGPPELPGLSAASVWITSSIRRPVRAQRAPEGGDHAGGHGRFKAERIADRDRELPAAHRLESPSGAYGRLRAASARSSARSVSGSSPSSRASMVRPSVSDRRMCSRAVDHVRVGEVSPSGEITTPEPMPPRPAAVASAGVDAHHRRADRVDDRGHGLRIGIEQHPLAGMLRHGRLRVGGIRVQEVSEGGIEHLCQSHMWLMGTVCGTCMPAAKDRRPRRRKTVVLPLPISPVRNELWGLLRRRPKDYLSTYGCRHP